MDIKAIRAGIKHLAGANLEDEDLSDLDLTGVNLAGATLVGANLSGSKIFIYKFRRPLVLKLNYLEMIKLL